ncbi:patatin-like phospholipase family protein [Serratia plymuthica]|uniref:Patatin-like phospholipase n=1 Tax=Serratia plymuthica TaxID=82996 RepID=A0A2X4Y8E5_SERPL|nr:patatin-like phospholipase family protein [Serratia plymuthica]QPS19452.1 patatin-like phospholipase family protein [Serratia plymuthica]QPS61164.1 patatin-like phospholipase family protein [Serratia plymuthica]RKS61772.1 NTE family protein [Serratia plymuthica]CAI2457052.1 Patatin-like phospholipase [Serratia plymuthica]SQI44764.1 Patatin-like phospholipase [Serratia plymuthica]
MKYQFENLVFEGGGVKGIAYGGVLDLLEAKGIMPQIKKTSGASAGAIAALLVGLGCSAAEVTKILSDMDFKKFLDYNGGFFGSIYDAHRLFNQYGIAPGDYFYSWSRNIIKRYTGNADITFEKFEALKETKGFKSLYFIGSNLNSGLREVYSHQTTPRMKVADGLRISMSFPFAFVAKNNQLGDLCIDGGTIDNYPVRMFDYDFTASPPYIDVTTQQINTRTLGIRLDSANEIAQAAGQSVNKTAINNLCDFTLAVVNTLLDIQTKVHLDSDDWKRTVYVDTLDVGTLDFAISEAKKRALIESGRQGVERYFAWYDAAVKQAA